MMKSKSLLVAFFVVLALSVGAQTKTSDVKLTLNWTAHPAYSMSGSDPNRVAYLKKAVAEWQKAYPKVTLAANVLSTNNAEAMAKLLEQASQGRAPDVAQIDTYILPRYLPYMQPIDDLIKAAGIDMKDFFPFAENIVRGKDGKIYGIQFTTDVRVLFYRKDLVPAAPKTWDDVLAVSKDLKAKGYDAFLFPAGRAEGAANTSLWPMFWGQGGQLVDASGKATFGAGENRAKMLNVLKFYKSLVDQGYSPARIANYGNEADLNGEVAAGKAAMFLGGNFQVAQLVSIFGADGMSKWGVARIPQKAGAKNATSAGGWSWGFFAKDAAARKAGFDLVLQAYIGNAGMANWCSVAGYLPTRKTIFSNPAYKSNEYSELFKNILESDGMVRPVAEIYPRISSEMQIALSSVISGTKTPEKALDDAWASVNK